MKKEEPQERVDPFSILLERMMLNPDVPADKIQVMLDMQENNLNRNAKVAFSVSMGQVQEQLRVVPEDKKNDQHLHQNKRNKLAMTGMMSRGYSFIDTFF